MENKYNFRIKFEKQEHSISADTYVQSLVSLSTIIREVNYQLGTVPAVTVNVLAEEPGSFDVALQIAEVIKENHEIIINGASALATIVGTTVSIIQLKKTLKQADESKTEINGDQVNIKDVEGNVMKIFHLQFQKLHLLCYLKTSLIDAKRIHLFFLVLLL